jgi:hypothetical protein
MALIIRIDVDRPYGRKPLIRHMLSRLSSDLYLPRIPAFGYLSELQTMLNWLNEAQASAYVFFRRCTLPSQPVLDLLESGGHEVGLHLENSRSFDAFSAEIEILETHFKKRILAVSKHGSGNGKYGFHHYAPYEPAKYTEWAERASMRLLLGNLEDPTLVPVTTGKGLLMFPSAFWLEPHWRDTKTFTIEWLLERASHQDVVLLVHPENVLADSRLSADFQRLIRTLDCRVLQ